MKNFLVTIPCLFALSIPCYANSSCQEETLSVRGSLTTAEYDWGALSRIDTVENAIYDLDQPYMGDGTSARGNIDYQCKDGNYSLQARPESAHTTDGKIVDYCAYFLIDIQCLD